MTLVYTDREGERFEVFVLESSPTELTILLIDLNVVITVAPDEIEER